LRQIGEDVSKSKVYAFIPQLTYRVRRDNYPDTPLPPEEPAGQNPPDGAILDYVLQNPATAPVALEISDANGKLVRRFSSSDKPEPVNPDELNIPTYWIRPAKTLSTSAGMHRFVWDMRYPPPDSLQHDYPISAIYHDTPRYPLGAAVLPGQYQVKLIVGGKSYTQPLTIKMDPRVQPSAEGLRQQFDLQQKIADAMHLDFVAVQEVRSLREQLKKTTAGEVAQEVAALEKKAADIEGSGGSTFLNTPEGRSLTRLNAGLSTLFGQVDAADVAPTTQQVAMFSELESAVREQLDRWQEIKSKDVPALNRNLEKAGAAKINIARADIAITWGEAEKAAGEDEP
jgi:hypothetical protein